MPGGPDLQPNWLAPEEHRGRRPVLRDALDRWAEELVGQMEENQVRDEERAADRGRGRMSDIWARAAWRHQQKAANFRREWERIRNVLEVIGVGGDGSWDPPINAMEFKPVTDVLLRCNINVREWLSGLVAATWEFMSRLSRELREVARDAAGNAAAEEVWRETGEEIEERVPELEAALWAIDSVNTASERQPQVEPSSSRAPR